MEEPLPLNQKEERMNWKTLGDRGFEALFERAFNRTADAIGEVVSGNIKRMEEIQKKASEKRAELLAYIRGIATASRDEIASENLFNRHEDRLKCRPRRYWDHRRYKPLDENLFVVLLIELKEALWEENERQVCLEMFVWLGRMSDEEFDIKLEFLNHDQFAQILKRVWVEIRDAAEKLPAGRDLEAVDIATAKSVRTFHNLLLNEGVLRGRARKKLVVPSSGRSTTVTALSGPRKSDWWKIGIGLGVLLGAIVVI